MWNQSPVSVADELHELVRVAEIADVGAARGQVAAQRDQVPDAVAAVLLQHVANAVARAADARQMRRAVHALGANLEHRRERAFARRTARAEGHRAERRLQRRELAARGAQLRDAFRRLRREELEAVERLAASCHRVSRVLSQPVTPISVE